MKKIISYLIIVIIFLSCGDNKEKIPPRLISQKEKDAPKKKEKTIATPVLSKPDLINNKNVTEKLTRFGKENPENKIKINTKFGAIKIKLYDDTPLHRANFIMLTKKHYFDSTLFYRVINNFMIQGGNSDRDNVAYKMSTIGNYQIPDEIKKHHFHKRGTIAMAVHEQYEVPKEQQNKNSSPYNFYIIQQNPISDKHMDKLEEHYHITIDEDRRKVYRKYGGVPHLDGNYTVFGEVYSGMNVVDKIAEQRTDSYDRPYEDLKISIEVIK